MLKQFNKTFEKPFLLNLISKIFSIGGRKRRLDDFISEIFEKECRGEVLEIGSGTGQFCHQYLKYVNTFTATDVNLDYLLYSKKEVKTIRYVVCDSSMLPFPSDRFDRIFALFMFHHLSCKMSLSSLRELNRCLREHSKIVIMDPFVPENKFDLIGWLLANIDRGRWIRKRGEFCKLLKQAELTIEDEIKIDGSWPYNMWTYILSRA